MAPRVASSLAPRIQAIAREVLTWIEGLESDAVRFGIFEATTRASDVLRHFVGRAYLQEPCSEPEVLHALRALREADELVLLARDQTVPEEPAGWVFRSRMGELVRLLAHLKQRFPGQLVYDAPGLVADVIWDVRARRYPRRDQDLGAYLASITPQDRAIVHDALSRFAQARLRPGEDEDEDAGPGAGFAFAGFQVRAMEVIGNALSETASEARGESAPDSAQGLVIEAGTGAGKTYSFLLPLLGYLVETRIRKGLPGCKVLCIYPRQPLAENQLQAVVNVLYHLNREGGATGEEQARAFERQVRVGIMYGRTPRSYRNRAHFENVRWAPAGADGFVVPFVVCPVCGGELLANPTAPGVAGERLSCRSAAEGQCSARPADLAYIRYARADFLGQGANVDPPDVLLCVTESLNLALGASDRRGLFGHGDPQHPLCIPQAVMLDEIHLQTGSKGMQVGYLLRRVLARLRDNRARLAVREAGFGHPEQDLRPVLVAGLSATVHQAKDFFSRLTGIPVRDIHRVAPDESAGEITLGDAEHLLFIKAENAGATGPLSTLLQTTMLLVHGYPQPADGAPPYRTFGFADSLDIVNRWYHDQQDTERPARGGPPLYRLRLPREPENVRAFRPVPRLTCDNCIAQGHPDRTCVAFQVGECWWPIYQGGLGDQLNIQLTTSQTASFREDANLVIATSKLEVGYDDDQLMVVIQYLAPRDLASFVQRKGRGGRQVGTRPIMAMVLSPFRPSDVFYFRNPHLLSDPSFRRLPLNPANALARQIHATYAFLDWVGNQAQSSVSLERLEPTAWDEVRRQVASEEDLGAYAEYLAGVFGLAPEDHSLASALVDHARGLYAALLPELDRAIADGADASTSGAQRWHLSNLLPRRIPPNLFSDIHLPLVRVTSQEGQLYDAGFDVDQALGEFVPGRVSFRYRRATWVPIVELLPAGSGRPQALDVQPAFSAADRPWIDAFTMNWRDVPLRLRARLGAQESLGSVTVKRPQAIATENLYQTRMFNGQAYDDRWRPRWSVDADAGVAALDGHGSTLNDKSNAFALRLTRVDFPGRASLLSRAVLRSDCDPGRAALGRDVGRFFEGLRFAVNAEGAGLLVDRAIVGTEYLLQHRQPRQSSQISSRVAAFTDSAGDSIALGYRGQCDGIEFELRTGWQGGLAFRPSAERVGHLRHAVYFYEARQQVLNEARANVFALSRLLELALAYVGRDPQGVATRLDAFTSGDRQAIEALDELLDGIFQHPSERTRRDVHALAENERVRRIIANVYRATFLGLDEGLLLRYREDVLRHTLKHALKGAVRLLSGAADRGEVAAHTELLLDFPDRAERSRPITVYEVGLEGVGMVQALYTDMQNDPRPFFQVLGDLVEGCDTAREERWQLRLLARDEAELEGLADLCRAALTATGVDDRTERIQQVRAQLWNLTRRPAEEWMLRAVFRTLGRELLVARAEGEPERIPEWRLYREINVAFLQPEEARLRRPLGPREARYRLRQALKSEPARYPTLLRLEQVLSTGGAGEPTADELDGLDYENLFTGPRVAGPGADRLDTFIERRLLTSCRTACPSCLQDQDCDVDQSPFGALLLDRHLLVELLETVRRDEVIVVPDDADVAWVRGAVRARFESAPIGVARLRFGAAAATVVDDALRDVLLRGVEAQLQLRRVGHLGDRLLPDAREEIVLELA